MKRILLVVLVLGLLNVPLSALPAQATPVEGCYLARQTDPVTVGVLGKTVHVPSLYVKACVSYTDNSIDPASLVPQEQPGTCGDPTRLCFSLVEDPTNQAFPTGVRVEYGVDGDIKSVSQPLPVIVGPTPICLFSTGYPVAPRHDCVAFIDQGA